MSEEREIFEADLAIVVCLPESETPITPGSTLAETWCGHRGWVAPVTKAYIESDPPIEVRLMCDRCVPSSMFTDPEVGKFLVPGFREEMNEVLGVAATDQIVAKAHAAGFKGILPHD